MEALTDKDIDGAALAGKRVAIIGYGNQGRAQALNLRDSGIDVVVGLREGSGSADRATADAIPVTEFSEAAAQADLVMMLVPDEVMAAVYLRIEPCIRPGAAIGFSHGLAIRFQFIVPRPDLDVIMVAPKGPGTALRSLFTQGKGMVALFAVERDCSGNAEPMALAYGQALGCGRAGLLRSSFAEECEADLFNEQAVVWGAVPEILIAGFDTLIDAGISEEVAYMECVGELKLLAELIEARGIAGMREAISNTAELGALVGGRRVIDSANRARMREIMTEIREGTFADLLREEEASAYPRLRESRARSRELRVEKARSALLP
ncbi:ketol-acid reductoisomerase [Sphingomonas xanthus]|uniref:Ketol-acid reductoisomerase n=1 Tax=Sphingomonas xanthus TaxID=2594473 RepID=A0A516IP38_9SPHN|nr:ketol-acid reductoisomerase [Sphingomonas xanthus]QDP18682.1 ketol-acid reductoisomerase [Sphingomonas xanthus]